MQIIDQCRARGKTYAFLSQLYLQGPVPETYPYIQAIPELADTLPSLVGDPVSNQSPDQDHLAADFYHIFGLNVLPYESSFLEPENVLEGPVTERVLADYWRAGFRPDLRSRSADHLGLELKFLSDLNKTQVEALEDQRIDFAGNMEAEVAKFIRGHLLQWLPGFTQAIFQQNMPFYSSLAGITLDLVIDHYQDLSRRGVHQHNREFQELQLPDPPDILLEENTGLKDIARYLLTPVYSGVYFSRDIIEGVAKNQSMPRGFGDRVTMLTNLLRNAADYDQLPSVLDDIKHIIDQWSHFYTHLPERNQDPNLLKPYATPWLVRIQKSQNLINHIHEMVSNQQDGWGNHELLSA